MLVKFSSSETGKVIMFAEHARPLVKAMGHECRAKGAITQPELPEALSRLRAALTEMEKAAAAATKSEGGTDQDDAEKKPEPIPLTRRAWPLLDMLERTAKAGDEAFVTWEATADFG